GEFQEHAHGPNRDADPSGPRPPGSPIRDTTSELSFDGQGTLPLFPQWGSRGNSFLRSDLSVFHEIAIYGSFEKICNTAPEEQALQQRGISRHRFKLRLS